jgi:probable rRNA maturation factor
LTVEIDNSSGDSVDINALQAQAEFLIEALSLHSECELSIAIVDVERMTELHVEWMDEPGPTDVLSFPMDELIEGDAEPGVLGDIVLCPAVVADQALAAGHPVQAEFELLLTHGMLHLLGHDHADEEEHRVMFARQDQLLAAWRESR